MFNPAPNRNCLIPLFVMIVLLMAGCTESTPAVFRPQGAAAREINTLWWILFGMGTAVYVLVMAFILFALFRRRNQATQADDPQKNVVNGRRIIWFGGIIIPAVILVVTYGFTLDVMMDLRLPTNNDRLVIEVTGYQWWWEVVYPGEDAITANEIYIPAGEEVLFELTSADVIHSFWVPELHGKMDLIPGRTNIWKLEADEPGEYWGLCAEFCGMQHAKMLFVVVAVPREEFDTWLEAQRQPAVAPTSAITQAGLDIFLEEGCAECHAIRGTEAAGDLGPDLTHLANRLTLGAGSVTNNRGNLAGWIADPHGIKPGSLMPTSGLSGEQLQSVVAYLESLE
ncbi:MAG: cytochrome c oxidase subunit II [Anaerolineaceae bacterium]|nr:cytochrome c oxidase subunit II [Anaerolineaceae bacterium]